MGVPRHTEARLKTSAPQHGSVSIEYLRVGETGEVQFVPAYAVHRPASRLVLDGHVYEPATHALVARYMGERPGSMVHAGTFFGDMLPSFSRSCTATVHAFEPVLENYVLARQCVDANDLMNVRLHHAALGPEHGTTRLLTERNGVHYGGASRVGGDGQSVSMLAIDMLDADDIVLVQLDVEGFEAEALRGATQTIEASRPAVLIEDNEASCAPLLESWGYAYVGSVPGLHAWAPAQESDAMARIITEVRQEAALPLT